MRIDCKCLFSRTTECPLCKRRLMARHSGPLHLCLEDVEGNDVIAARITSRSKSMNEVSKSSMAIDMETNEDCPVRDTLPAKSMYNQSKSVLNFDKNVRISREQSNAGEQSQCNSSASTIQQPLVLSLSADSDAEELVDSRPLRRTSQGKSPRKNGSNVRIGQNQCRDGRRKSGRIRNSSVKFNIAKIQCSVCQRSFMKNVPISFYNEPIACSYKCLRFNSCI